MAGWILKVHSTTSPGSFPTPQFVDPPLDNPQMHGKLYINRCACEYERNGCDHFQRRTICERFCYLARRFFFPCVDPSLALSSIPAPGT